MSIEEGLFLLANPLCETIIKSCIARAQSLYKVTVCHAIVEGSHLHMIVVVNDPDDVHQFARHLKTEIAHRINRLLGRGKRTVWCEGYDSPVVLTPTRAIMAIAYLYANPAKDNLEDSIDKYPAFSTWKMFRKGEHSRLWKWIHRYSYKTLPLDAHNYRGYSKEADRLRTQDAEYQRFTIEPNAWMEAFGIVDEIEQKQINERLVQRIRLLEERARRKRISQKKSVIGREKLIKEPINTNYRPKRGGRRMWCLSEVRAKRAAFINFCKSLIKEGKRVRDEWRLGNTAERYPLGLYPPAVPKLGEPLVTM